ncbi:MAG TPA: amylo-alpha-1,6-glucosidase, partial [bacterium]|nr:amylo-alpha-1,6-glucosidase [bacterium]
LEKVRDFNEFVLEIEAARYGEAVRLISETRVMQREGLEEYLKGRIKCRNPDKLAEKIKNQKLTVYVNGLTGKQSRRLKKYGTDVRDSSKIFQSRTRLVELAVPTIIDNSRFYEDAALMEVQAPTMGIGTIMEAGSIILLSSGEKKAEALRRSLEEPVSLSVAASVLQKHADVTFLLDPASASLLKKSVRESGDKYSSALGKVRGSIDAAVDPQGRFNASGFKFKLWTRDISLGLWGLISAGVMPGRVRSNLELMINNIREDGLAPLHLGHYYNYHYQIFGMNSPVTKFIDRALLFIGKDNYNTPRYTVAQSRNPNEVALDNNALLIIASAKYRRKTRDEDFLKKNYLQLSKALSWYFGQTLHGTLSRWKGKPSETLLQKYSAEIEGKDISEIKKFAGGLQADDLLIYGMSKLSTWEDSVRKKGFIVNNNVLYYKALLDMSELARFSGKTKKAEFYALLAGRLKEILLEEFWDYRGFLVDWEERDPNRPERKLRRASNFDSPTNLLAVYFGLLDGDKARQVIEYIRMNGIDRAGLIATRYQEGSEKPFDFEKSDVDSAYRVGGMGDYHGKTRWPWIEGLYLAVLSDMAVNYSGSAIRRDYYSSLASERLGILAGALRKNPWIEEVTYSDGTPKKWRIGHKSQNPFFWASGVILEGLERFRELEESFRSAVGEGPLTEDETLRAIRLEQIMKRVETVFLSGMERNMDSERGIPRAGGEKFMFWARDNGFAALGFLGTGQHNDLVRKTLDLFYDNISSGGQIPIHIGHYYKYHTDVFGLESPVTKRINGLIKRFKGIDNENTPKYYAAGDPRAIPIDNNPVFVILAKEYYLHPELYDEEELRKRYPDIRKALLWDFSQSEEVLIGKKDNRVIDFLDKRLEAADTGEILDFIDSLAPESALLYSLSGVSTWLDLVNKKGYLSSANVLHYKAVADFAEISRKAGKDKEAVFFELLAEKIKSEMMKLLWDSEEGRFIDWVQGDTRRTEFDTSANLFAIKFELVSPDQAESIIDYIRINQVDVPGMIHTMNPPLPPMEDIHRGYRLGGMDDYSLGESRCQWIEALYLDVLSNLVERHFRKKESNKVEKYRTIAEERFFIFSKSVNQNAYSQEESDRWGKYKSWKIGPVTIHRSVSPFTWADGFGLMALISYAKMLKTAFIEDLTRASTDVSIALMQQNLSARIAYKPRGKGTDWADPGYDADRVTKGLNNPKRVLPNRRRKLIAGGFGETSDLYSLANHQKDFADLLKGMGYREDEISLFSIKGPGNKMGWADTMAGYEIFRSSLIRYLKLIPEGEKVDIFGHSNGGRHIMEFIMDERNKVWLDKIGIACSIASPLLGIGKGSKMRPLLNVISFLFGKYLNVWPLNMLPPTPRQFVNKISFPLLQRPFYTGGRRSDVIVANIASGGDNQVGHAEYQHHPIADRVLLSRVFSYTRNGLGRQGIHKSGPDHGWLLSDLYVREFLRDLMEGEDKIRFHPAEEEPQSKMTVVDDVENAHIISHTNSDIRVVSNDDGRFSLDPREKHGLYSYGNKIFSSIEYELTLGKRKYLLNSYLNRVYDDGKKVFREYRIGEIKIVETASLSAGGSYVRRFKIYDQREADLRSAEPLLLAMSAGISLRQELPVIVKIVSGWIDPDRFILPLKTREESSRRVILFHNTENTLSAGIYSSLPCDEKKTSGRDCRMEYRLKNQQVNEITFAFNGGNRSSGEIEKLFMEDDLYDSPQSQIFFKGSVSPRTGGHLDRTQRFRLPESGALLRYRRKQGDLYELVFKKGEGKFSFRISRLHIEKELKKFVSFSAARRKALLDNFKFVPDSLDINMVSLAALLHIWRNDQDREVRRAAIGRYFSIRKNITSSISGLLGEENARSLDEALDYIFFSQYDPLYHLAIYRKISGSQELRGSSLETAQARPLDGFKNDPSCKKVLFVLTREAGHPQGEAAKYLKKLTAPEGAGERELEG